MRKFLDILEGFEGEHVQWLTTAGQERNLEAGQVLIREGEPLDSVYIVVEGTFGVTRGETGDEELARVGSREVLGEVSYVDRHPPTATVTSLTHSVVLDLSRERLEEKIGTDMAFAARFYNAVATSLADRFRRMPVWPKDD